MTWRIRASADISPCGQYRWWLRRTLPTGDGQVICFLMLNPSTADDTTDDPTIRRCLGFVRTWDASTLSVRNLYPYRATHPRALAQATDPCGGTRGLTELLAGCTAHVTIAAWGAHPLAMHRAHEVLPLLRAHLGAKPLWCLGMTKHGAPRHPLYVRRSQILIPFYAASEVCGLPPTSRAGGSALQGGEESHARYTFFDNWLCA